MDVQALFERHWARRFPDDKPPIVLPAVKTMGINNISDDSGRLSGSPLNDYTEDPVKREAQLALKACQNRIDGLEKELIKERFMCDYLENFLSGDSVNVNSVSSNSILNGATTTESTTELNNSSANLPDPWDVGVGEISYRVIKGKHSRDRLSPANKKHLVSNSKQDQAHMPVSAIQDGSIESTAFDTLLNENNHSADSKQPIDKCLLARSINTPALLKGDSEQASYVGSESDLEKVVQAEVTADISNTLDKSTSTEISPELLTQTASLATCGKTNFRPVPLPRPKRQPRLPLTDLFNHSVDEGCELTEGNTRSSNQHPELITQAALPFNGTEDLPRLHSHENSFVIRRKVDRVQSPGLAAQVEHQHLPERGQPVSGESLTFTGDDNVLLTSTQPGHCTGSVPSERYNSKESNSLEDDLYSETVSDLCVKTPEGVAGLSHCSAEEINKFITQNSESKEDGLPDKDKSGSQSYKNNSEKMLRKLGQRTSERKPIGITGLKYQPRTAYETVDFVKGTPLSVTDIDQQGIMASSEMNTADCHDNRLSSAEDDDQRVSVTDMNSDNSEFREPLYETLVVDKSFHAALTTEDESFDSLSLNSSDNEARSDGDLSVDSGVGSKLSVDSHQPASPDLMNGVDPKDPYSALYATVSKLKHESSGGNQSDNEPNISAPVVPIKPTAQYDRIREKHSHVSETQPDIEKQPSFQNPTYDHAVYLNDSDDLCVPPRNSDTKPLRREHDYEDCIPPGLEPPLPAKPVPVRKAPELPARMRIDHPDGKPGSNRSSQETISSARNSYDRAIYSSDSSDGEHNELKSPEREKQRLRKLVLCGILETEKEYLACLDILHQYMKTLEAAAASSQPVISPEDIKVIFYRIPNLFNIHTKFVRDLDERVNNWCPLQTVGDLFKVLISNFPVYSDYMKNYSKAVELIRKCSEEKPQFKDIAEQMYVTNSKGKEKTNLQNMLFKPVVRIQRNTLVLHDLMNCTPKSHKDYKELDNALSLSHLNLEEFEDPALSNSSSKIEKQQHLVKNSFMVESVGGQRKLRYIFLFSDVIVCTKQKISGRSQRHNFEVKWYAPLSDIIQTDHRIDQQGGDCNRDSRLSNMEEVDELKKRVSVLKSELRQEMKKEKASESKEKAWSFAARSATKAIEKIKKKLHEQEAALVQASPNLPFKMYHKSSGKSYIFLMSTDYEREEWSEAIQANQAKFKSDLIKRPPTAYDIQMLIENVKQLPKVNSVGHVLLRNCDDDGLHGILNVTIHRLSGLQKPSDTFCCLELDSYGHFFMTARTNVCRGEENPVWDEEFEIDLDGSQTLRLLCYRRGNESEGDVLLGKSALELKTHWLREKFQEKVISLNEYSLVVSIRYMTAATTMKRLPSRLKTGVFGVKITTLAKREGRKMPNVVMSCVEEIERRGTDETGIYRVSGVTSEVQRLKKAFDKNSRAAVHLLADYDIHAVAGALKLYFRELPEPLFSEALYGNFINSLELTDAEAKEKCMLSLLHLLPETSLRTVIYLIDHLIRISKHQDENRMNLNNLATIFGPTLLRPAAKDPGTPTTNMLFLGAQEALSQTAVLLYFIKLREEGKDLSKPTAS